MRAQSVQRRSVFLKTIRLARCRLVHGATEITTPFQPSKSRNFSGYLSRLRASSSRDGRARSSLARPDGGGGASSCAARYASTGGAFGSAHSLGCSNVHHSALAVVSSREHLRAERDNRGRSSSLLSSRGWSSRSKSWAGHVCFAARGPSSRIAHDNGGLIRVGGALYRPTYVIQSGEDVKTHDPLREECGEIGVSVWREHMRCAKRGMCD